MGHCALEVKAVTRFEAVLLTTQKNLQLPLEYEQKFFAHMSIGFAAACAGGKAEQVWFHHRISPGEQFHANPGACFQDFARFRTDQVLVRFRGVVEGEYMGFVIASK